jgi:hypothetical protein
MTRGIVQGFAHDSIGFSKNRFIMPLYWQRRELFRSGAERLQLGLWTSRGEKKVERVAGIEPYFYGFCIFAKMRKTAFRLLGNR